MKTLILLISLGSLMVLSGCKNNSTAGTTPQVDTVLAPPAKQMDLVIPDAAKWRNHYATLCLSSVHFASENSQGQVIYTHTHRKANVSYNSGTSNVTITSRYDSTSRAAIFLDSAGEHPSGMILKDAGKEIPMTSEQVIKFLKDHE